MKCKICGNEENNKAFDVKEMMFGTLDSFVYFQCSCCKCLQIAELPNDLSKYYPEHYLSFSRTLTEKASNTRQKLTNIYSVFSMGFYTKFKCLMGIFCEPFLNKHLYRLKNCCINKDSPILDVGCGNGRFLYALRVLGFKSLLGIDPYLKDTIIYDNGVKIVKQTINEVSGQWDLIMFHHSFEHIPCQLDTLNEVYRLLSPQGVCIVRIPTVSSYAWEYYGTNWFALDAPRHLFLHSIKSICMLANMAKLNIEDIMYDSTSLQFWASEQYIRDIPFMDNRSFAVSKRGSIFSIFDIIKFFFKTRKLNEEKRGDYIAVYLRKQRKAGQS